MLCILLYSALETFVLGRYINKDYYYYYITISFDDSDLTEIIVDSWERSMLHLNNATIIHHIFWFSLLVFNESQDMNS